MTAVIIFAIRHLPGTARPVVPDSRNDIVISPELASNQNVFTTARGKAPSDSLSETDPAVESKLPREKVEEYLRRHHRSAGTLLAAFHALDDTNYLNEAAKTFPNNPQVQWTVLMRNAFPEERREWLDAFKSSSPDNSLANYLSARDYLESGNVEAAVKELAAAHNKIKFQDYAMEAQLESEELSLDTGTSG